MTVYANIKRPVFKGVNTIWSLLTEESKIIFDIIILIDFRKIRSNEMKIPAYYVFTNDELDKLVELKPKTIEQLKKSNILSPIKIKTHGNEIINEINK